MSYRYNPKTGRRISRKSFSKNNGGRMYCPHCGKQISNTSSEPNPEKRKSSQGPGLAVAWIFIAIFAAAFLWSIAQGGM